MAKKKVVNDPNVIDLGPSTELPTQSDLNTSAWNFVLVHRHYDPLMRWWGNLNSHWMGKLILSYDDKPKDWKIKLFNLTQNQYDKYGDYWRMLDTSFAEPGADDIYEVMEK